MLRFECFCFAISVIDFLPFLLGENAKALPRHRFVIFCSQSKQHCLTLIFVADVWDLNVSQIEKKQGKGTH